MYGLDKPTGQYYLFLPHSHLQWFFCSGKHNQIVSRGFFSFTLGRLKLLHLFLDTLSYFLFFLFRTSFALSVQYYSSRGFQVIKGDVTVLCMQDLRYNAKIDSFYSFHVLILCVQCILYFQIFLHCLDLIHKSNSMRVF